MVSYEKIEKKNYSFSAGQYFEIKFEYVDISVEEFNNRINALLSDIEAKIKENHQLEKEIKKQVEGVIYEK